MKLLVFLLYIRIILVVMVVNSNQIIVFCLGFQAEAEIEAARHKAIEIAQFDDFRLEQGWNAKISSFKTARYVHIIFRHDTFENRPFGAKIIIAMHMILCQA